MNYSGYLKDNEGNKYYTEIGVQELNVSALLKNSWELHYGAQIYKEGNTVHVLMTVKKGIATQVLELPIGFRPSEQIFFPTTVSEQFIDGNYCEPYISISSNGKVYVPQANVGKLIFINAIFKA